jgi:hypothetical protein
MVFDDPEVAFYQRMDGELVAARADFRPGGRAGHRPPFATLRVERPAPDRLLLSGELRDHPVAITLERVDPGAFTLRSRGFHWVQDHPYFR